MSPHQAAMTKAEEAKEIIGLIQRFKAVGVASLQKVRAAQLQELRKKLSKEAHLRVIKNTLIKKVLDLCGDKQGIERLGEHLAGSNIFLFTNLNPFKLAILLEKNKVKTSAKAGDLAAFDVTIPAGNTGLPPGPIISQFTAIGVPTRIESGSVCVSKDSLVAKKGEVITARMTSILSKLGIKPVEIGLTMKAMYDEGAILTEEQLRIDLDEIQEELEQAHNYAFNLSLAAGFATSINVTLLFKIAHHEAFWLALNTNFPTKDTIADLIRKANWNMLSLSSRLAINSEETTSSIPVQKG